MKYSERTYKLEDSCFFRKTRESFGGLSNMSTDYQIEVNGVKIPTIEALYQACRYPHLPEVQTLIIDQRSPMTAKMKSKSYYDKSRSDWEEIKVTVMRWCLRIKLAQHFFKFGRLLEATLGKNIVEESRRDRFWGAQRTDTNELHGVNALGRLLMELRQNYCSEARYNFLYVALPKIENFTLFGKDIEPVDSRLEFVVSLLKSWQRDTSEVDKVRMHLIDLLTNNHYDYFSYSIGYNPEDETYQQGLEEATTSSQKEETETGQRIANLSLF